MGIPILDTGQRSMARDWDAVRTYDIADELVRFENREYRSVSIVDNLNKTPGVAANKTFWHRLSPKIFDQEDDPTSTDGGEWEVIEGDRWITYTAIPSGVFSRDTAPLARIRQGTNWMLVNSGVNVVADADNWGTTDKATSLVILEKHITHPEMPGSAIDFGFKNRAGSWKRAKLWQLPWGQIHKYSWSGSFYTWNNC
jgi:hypothetical protein